MDFLKIVNETEKEFETIASMLFNNFVIQADKALYRFVEIEFYWNSSNHIDNSTYQRKHVDPKSGDWFFHYSGVDIALKNEQTGGYGGILIRSIYDIDKKAITKGPMICAMKLFSGTNAFTESIKTKVVAHTFEKSEIIKGNRIGLGLNAKENGSDKLNYRFVINPNK
jgi:hypothetical protein